MTINEVIAEAKKIIKWAPEKEKDIKDVLKQFKPYRDILGGEYELSLNLRASRIGTPLLAERLVSELTMFMNDRKRRCEEELTSKYGNARSAIIDGETETKIIGVVQSVLLIVCACIFIGLVVFWTKNKFPAWLGGDKDTIFFVLERGIDIMLSVIPIFVAVFIGAINKKRIKKRYKNSNFSYEEKIAVKYNRELKPMKIVQIQIAIINNGNQTVFK